MRSAVLAAASLLLWVAGVLTITLSDVQEWDIANDPYGRGAEGTPPVATATVVALVVGIVVLWAGVVLGLLIWGLRDRRSFQRTVSANRTVLQRLGAEQYRDVLVSSALLAWSAVAAVIGAASILMTLQHAA